ncbi:hypothetical protein Efla_002885 [Eimeria flavescens]
MVSPQRQPPTLPLCTQLLANRCRLKFLDFAPDSETSLHQLARPLALARSPVRDASAVPQKRSSDAPAATSSTRRPGLPPPAYAFTCCFFAFLRVLAAPLPYSDSCPRPPVRGRAPDRAPAAHGVHPQLAPHPFLNYIVHCEPEGRQREGGCPPLCSAVGLLLSGLPTSRPAADAAAWRPALRRHAGQVPTGGPRAYRRCQSTSRHRRDPRYYSTCRAPLAALPS